jgi:hypothetical protein
MALTTVIQPANGSSVMNIVDVTNNQQYTANEIVLSFDEITGEGTVLFDGAVIVTYPSIGSLDDLDNAFDDEFDILDDERY